MSDDFAQIVGKLRYREARAEYRSGGAPDLEHFARCAEIGERWMAGMSAWARDHEDSDDDEDRTWATYILALDDLHGWLPLTTRFGVSELFLEFADFYRGKYPEETEPWEEA